MLPKNSGCVEYYATKQAKREAKEERLRRERERAERLAAQEAVVSQQRARVEAEERAARALKYGYSYYTAPAVQEKEKRPEFPERADRTVKQSAYNRMLGAPNSNRRLKTRLPAPMDLLSDDVGNKVFGKIKSVEQTTRWSSSYV